MNLEEFPASDPEFWSHPEQFLEHSRATCPVTKLPGDAGYIMTRYDDVRAASVRVKEFSSNRPGFGQDDPELAAIAAQGLPEVATITTNDPPVHTRYRKLVNKAFTPEVVEGLEPKIRRLADDVFDSVAATGEMDFVGDFAEVLPTMVMSDALGIPYSMRQTFRTWSDNIVDMIAADMVLTPERRRECRRSYVEFQHYFADLIEERRDEPSDDMISQLVGARLNGERSLDVPELLDIIRILLVAGNDTTTNLLGGGLLALLDNPDQLAAVQADRMLIPQMIEEALRYVSPARWTIRVVADSGVEVAGCPIPAGEIARLAWGSANRDETRFPDADKFDIFRDSSAHMAFGHGVHFCIGKDLARSEARIAFEALFDHFGDFELTVPRAELQPLPVPGINRLNKLPIRFRVK
ncbi:cytochrome P450 [Nocardia jiangxiensis]|uniref:cytochrome P450 n=1 Tax=Nocardia jiangxiensis TaxID=282685 RepID=UPI000318E626|nr:cytochrome P450 [Nocardia jiangxiensis]